MNTWSFLSVQNVLTLVLVLAIAVFLLVRVRRSQRRRGESDSSVHYDRPGTGRTPPP
jgi:membrane protein implicated in regulation of membrane protease activity